jgi:hypothetical protein
LTQVKCVTGPALPTLSKPYKQPMEQRAGRPPLLAASRLGSAKK